MILGGSISSHAFYAVASMQAAARSRAHDAQLSFAQLFARRPFYFTPLYAPSLLVREGPAVIQGTGAATTEPRGKVKNGRYGSRP
jgi:hypothetical protein